MSWRRDQNIIAVTAILVLLSGTRGRTAAQGSYDIVGRDLRERIESARDPQNVWVRGEKVRAFDALSRFFRARAFQPAWSLRMGITDQARALVRFIQAADQEGLDPSDYHLNCIQSILSGLSTDEIWGVQTDTEGLVDLDIILTDAFLLYGSHLLTGRTNLATVDLELSGNHEERDLAVVLEAALASSRIEDELDRLRPAHQEYVGLCRALALYRKIAEQGGWPVVPEGPTIRKGESAELVVAIRNRLACTGDLKTGRQSRGAVFDEKLEEAVRRFQRRHGLEVDGAVGKDTYIEMNVPVEQRLRQIELNLERWRWFPDQFEDRHITVNIADFGLGVIEHREAVLSMRVVVGKGYRRTPVFSDEMTYLVFNPRWYIPPFLAIEDKLPLIRKDPGYCAKHNIRVFRGLKGQGGEVNPDSVDWKRVTAENFNFLLRQEPGPSNSLGRVKFMLPNKYDVYLHDTPSRGLFDRHERTFSSGCIRIEKPIELAEYLLREDAEWSPQRIRQVVASGAETTVRLQKPIPVHVLYWTAWMDPDGTVNFRNDIYGQDDSLARAFMQNAAF